MTKVKKENITLEDDLRGSRDYTFDDATAIDSISLETFNPPSSLLLRYGENNNEPPRTNNNSVTTKPIYSSSSLRRNKQNSRGNTILSSSANDALIDYSIEDLQQTSVSSQLSRGNNNNNKKIPRPPQKLVSGSQFRFINKEHLIKCEQCDIFDKVIKKNKETIRSLKFQLARLEEQYHDLKLSKSMETLNNVTVSSNSAQESGEQKQKKEKCDICINLEHEVSKLNRLLAYERTSNEGLRKAFFELRGTLEVDISTANRNVMRLEEELKETKNFSQSLEKSNADLTMTLTNYRQQLEKTELQLNECLIRLNSSNASLSDIDNLREIERLKNELSSMTANNRSMSEKLNTKSLLLNRSEEQLELTKTNLSERLAETEDMKLAVKKAEADLRSSQEIIHVEKRRGETLESRLKGLSNENYKISTVLSKTEADLETHKSENINLSKELEQLRHKVEEINRKNLLETENSKKALEKAINTSVRLCVVAPTVNVHVADKKLKFKSGIKENTLKEFLNAEILDRYSFLYKQKHDNSSPSGGNLEAWLQKLLSQMQTSIETHVNSAMEGSEV